MKELVYHGVENMDEGGIDNGQPQGVFDEKGYHYGKRDMNKIKDEAKVANANGKAVFVTELISLHVQS